MKYTINPFTGDLVPCGGLAGNMQQRSINFAHDTPSSKSLRTTQGNTRILEIIIGIDASFNGSGWSLSVGDNNNNQRLVAPAQVGLDKVDKFEFSPGVFYSDRTQVYLYLNAGSATVGSGFIYLLEA